MTNFAFRDFKKNTINFNRIKSSWCDFCCRNHDNDHTLYIYYKFENGKFLFFRKCRKNVNK